LLLHEYDGRPYYLGAFLIGAYQEILGDMHNLFGDTHAVHVELAPDGEVVLETIVKGDTVQEVLRYVEFNEQDLIGRLQAAVDVAVREARMDNQQAGKLVKFYEQALSGYTYLEEP
jgi:arginine decarboxylase